MKIIFKKLEIHNFKSFDDETFDFESQTGLNLICGKNNDLPGSRNGSGKSALFSALVFSLFGQTQENIKNCNVANKYVNTKEMRVVTYFDIDSHHYKVCSGFNKYGGPYCQLFDTIDGNEVELTKSTMSETRKYLADEILRCDLSIFLRTILLSSDQNYNFFRLRKWEKKEFIEKLFDISVFGEMYNVIHHDVLDFDKEIYTCQYNLLSINKNVADYKERMLKHESEKAEKLKSLNENLDSLYHQQEQLKSLDIKENSDIAQQYQDAITKLSNAIETLKQNLQELTTKKSSYILQEHKLQASIDSKQKIIDKHHDLLSKLCDDCKTIFQDYYSITTYMSEIDQMTKEIQTIKGNEISIENQIANIDKKILKCTEKTDELTEKLNEVNAEYNQKMQQLAMIDASISSYEREIGTLADSANPYQSLYDKSEVELSEKTKSLSQLEERYRYLKFAESIVSQETLRKFIISDLIGLLNAKIKSYLVKFGAKYDVTFDSDMNYTFSTDGGEFEYDNFSSGEKARLMIAACFAFRDFMHIRNSFSSNILILDEFIDGAIDQLAIESILEILKDFSKIWNQNIFVISHRKEVNNDVFNHIIQIVKTNNISKIHYLE